MRQLTIQEQYNLLKEGKFNEYEFVKSATKKYPQYINPGSNQLVVENILLSKGVITKNNISGDNSPLDPARASDWMRKFNDTLSEEIKAKLTSQSEEVSAFDKKSAYDDKEDPNNLISNEIIKGLRVEFSKNPKLTEEQALKKVYKNLIKNPIYYLENALYGVDGLKSEQLKEPKAPVGPHKGSGYGTLKESIGSFLTEESDLEQTRLVAQQLADALTAESVFKLQYKYTVNRDIDAGHFDLDIIEGNPEHDPRDVGEFAGGSFSVKPAGDHLEVYNAANGNALSATADLDGTNLQLVSVDDSESSIGLGDEEIEEDIYEHLKEGKMSKETIWTKIKEIEVKGNKAALEAKIAAINEELEARQNKLTTVEGSDDLSDFISPVRIKEVKKEIMELGKVKHKWMKMLERLGGAAEEQMKVDIDVQDQQVQEGKGFKYRDFFPGV